VLQVPSWTDFSNIDTLDEADLSRHIRDGRKTLLTQSLTPDVFCAVLRCALRSDVTRRQARFIGDVIASMNCP
jgi:hypothetical protein